MRNLESRVRGVVWKLGSVSRGVIMNRLRVKPEHQEDVDKVLCDMVDQGLVSAAVTRLYGGRKSVTVTWIGPDCHDRSGDVGALGALVSKATAADVSAML